MRTSSIEARRFVGQGPILRVGLRSRRAPIVALAPLLGLGLLAGLFLAGASPAAPAFAHDTVVSSSPYNGEVVSKSIDTVSVTFSDDLLALGMTGDDADGFAIEITDAAGGHYESGCVSVDGAVASTGVALGAAGTYTVTWKVVTDDSHNVSGTYSFVWKPTSVTVAAPAFDASPACGEYWSGLPMTATPSATDPSSSGPVGSTTNTPNASETDVPEPTMTILSAVPADGKDDSGLVVPLAIVIGVGVLAALSALLFTVVRRVRSDEFKDS